MYNIRASSDFGQNFLDFHTTNLLATEAILYCLRNLFEVAICFRFHLPCTLTRLFSVTFDLNYDSLRRLSYFLRAATPWGISTYFQPVLVVDAIVLRFLMH